jgi:hypothetical protein
MSSEVDNLLIATLSAGPVGVGDPLGAVDAVAFGRAVRKDGVIVKPDAPPGPTDQTVIQDAQDLKAPMVAFTYTDFGDMRVVYVFVYARCSGRQFSLRADSLGLHGNVYVYNYFTGSGRVTNAANLFSGEIEGSYAYYVVTPVGPSGSVCLAMLTSGCRWAGSESRASPTWAI